MAITVNIKDNKIFAPLLDKWLPLNQEEKIKQEFISRLVNFYGYDIEQLGQDVEIKNKVKVDIAIWKSKGEKQKKKIPSIIIAIECKAEHVSIKKEDILLSYKLASSVNASFFIATNLKETKVYHILQEPITRKFEKLGDIPHAEKIINDKALNDYLNQTKTFTRDEFSKLLFKCHSIIRNNDKLSPEAAFDEISKILFMKIMYERKSKEELIFSLEKFRSLEKNYEQTIRPTLKKANPNFDLDYMQFQFEETKRNFEKDEIFDENDRIKIRKNSFEQIVKELESFNLSDTSDDIKGIAFEEFLGKTFRGELGQFFTPRTIVDYMVEILDPQEGERVCDPCCGSGGFLIKAFEYVREKIEKDIQGAKEKIRKENYTNNFENLSEKKQTEIHTRVENLFDQLNHEFDLQNEKGRLRNLSYDCIFGTDANPRMARTAKMNMIMHGDGHGGVHHHDGLLNVNGIYDGRFDVIFTNPPFGSRVEKTSIVSKLDIPNEEKIELYKEKYGPEYESKVIQPLIEWANEPNGKKGIGKPILDLFETGKMSGLTEVLFIERCLRLLKPGGRMSIVLPDGVLNTSSLQKVREFVESRAKIINITSIPQDVFIASGATVKPSLLFLKKFSHKEAMEYQEITNATIELVNKKYKLQENELKATLEEAERNHKSAAKALKEINVLKGKKKGNAKFNKEEYQKLIDKEGRLKAELKTAKAKYTTSMKVIEQQKAEEVKAIVKEKFDYLIPIVEVERAGISSTGSQIENELKLVEPEFTAYRRKEKLWDELNTKFNYVVESNGTLKRTSGKNKPETFYGS